MLLPQPVTVTDLAENVVPEGEYTLQIVKATYVAKPKSADAKPYVHLHLRITSPTDVGLGRMVFMSYPIDGDASYRLRELLEMTGHPEDFVLEMTEQLEGLVFRAVVSIKSDPGWPAKNVVRKHLPL
jgi:hypothetical protein